MRIISFLLIGVASLRAAAQPADVESTVRAFYRAYASGDVVRAKTFWTQADADGFAARESRTLRVRCLRLDALSVQNASIDGDRASVSAKAWMTRWSAMPGAVADDEPARSALRLRLENGAWKIAEWVAAEDELAERVAMTADRAALLADPSLWNRRLVVALDRRVIMQRNRDQYALATRVVALSREVAEATGDAAALADVLAAESVLARGNPVNDVPRSVRMAEQAVLLAEQAHDADALARTLLRLANARMAGGQGDVEAFERVLALADFIEQPSVLALAASGVTRSHLRDGHVRDSLRTANAAAEWAQESGDAAAIISAEMTLAGTYIDRRDAGLALPHALRAAELAKKMDMSSVRVAALKIVAICDWVDGRDDLAAAALDEAVQGSGDVRTRVDMLVSRAAERREAKRDYAGAERDLQEAACLDATMTGRPDAGWIELATAALRLDQGRLDDAMHHLAAFRQLGGVYGTDIEGAILAAMGRPAEARALFEDVLDGFESKRSNIDDQVQRTLFMTGAVGAYAFLAEILLDMGQQREALAVAERSKARVLRELLAGGERTTARNASVDERNAQVTALNRQLLDIERDGGDPTAVMQRLRRARGALEEAEVSAGSPLAAQPASGPYDLRTLRAPDDTVVLEYVVGPKKTIVFVAYAEEGDTVVQAHTIRVDARSLRAMVHAFAQRIEQRDARYRPAARELYDLLVAPLIGSVPSSKTLCIIPDSTLWTLPFQALVAGDGRHLIEHAVVYYSPSLANLNLPRRPQSNVAPTLLAMGDPEVEAQIRSELRSLTGGAILGRLPDAEREVRELGRIYGARATVRVGRAAEEALLKKHGAEYSVLHLATHGIVDEHSPMYSSLLLAGSATEDGLLEAREIVDLPLQADLVVLSACDTAGGRLVEGEGVLGVSWAILATGVPRTVATQWPISSAAAAKLMIAFHQRLARRPAITRVAETLRAAQLEMLRSRDAAHPYYWAPFILIGRD